MPDDYFVVTTRRRGDWVADVCDAIKSFGEVRVLSEEEFDKKKRRKSTSPEMVIIDGSVGRSLKLVHQAQQRFPGVRVVLATAAPSWEQARAAYRAGAAEVIEKSLQSDEIVRRLISPRVLLVDNKSDFLETQAEFLRDAGWTVLVAESSDEAETKMKDEELDLAFLDIRMADDTDEMDQSGLKLAKRANPEVPKVLLTGFPSIEVTQKALRYDKDQTRLAEDILDKQEPLEEILAVACRVLRESRRRRRFRVEAMAAGGPAGLLPPAGIEEMAEDLRELQSRVEPPVLDNYSGYVCSRFEGPAPQRGQGKRGRPGHSGAGRLVVWLQPKPPKREGVFADALQIRDGQDADEVAFDLEVESDELRFTRYRVTVEVQPGQQSRHVAFPCKNAGKGGSHKAWVQVFQKNRLIQVLAVDGPTDELASE